MRPFLERKDPVRLLRRRLLIVCLLLLIAVTVRGVWGVYKKEHESRVLRDEAEIQLADLRAREASLRGDISKLKSDRGMEEVLREEYELAKHGEGLIVIVEPNASLPDEKSRTMEWLHRALPWWY
ncbi:MAG: hypothetical protein G01um10148_417 [Parcubacteria group bacterium Gr01-1014_8]|nr:MAG: hypothetical protein G01um10148_417 [Parcubacteria group bacterium Gr01-1014_8]